MEEILKVEGRVMSCGQVEKTLKVKSVVWPFVKVSEDWRKEKKNASTAQILISSDTVCLMMSL